MEKQNKSFMMLIIGLILALFLLVGQSYMLTSNNQEREVILVTGNSELSVAPDKAEIYLKIRTENDDAVLAQEQNKQISAKVIEALKSQGIDAKDIETTNFRLNEQYRPIYYDVKELELKEKIPKYEVIHTLKIKTTKLDSIGTLVDVSINSGATGVDTINYVLSDEKEKEVRSQALDKAILAGKEKAQSMTKVLNVKLGKVTNIQENNYYYTPYRFDANIKAEALNGAGEQFESLNYLSPQNVEIRSTVQLTFELK